MKRIPAVFFQKKLNGDEPAPKIPERLELFESELRAAVGGARAGMTGVTMATATRGDPDGSGGTTTYSYSAGWLDVLQADDCTY